jgi:hypothetical protein
MLKRTLGRVPRRWLVNYAYAEVRARHGAAQPWILEKVRVLLSTIAAASRWV